MCLTRVTRQCKDNDKISVVYKVFIKIDKNKYEFPVYKARLYKQGKPKIGSVHTNNWRTSIIWDFSEVNAYTSGFHGFTNISDAREYIETSYPKDWHCCIIECIAWNITAYGYQSVYKKNLKCLVAQNIQLIREV